MIDGVRGRRIAIQGRRIAPYFVVRKSLLSFCPVDSLQARIIEYFQPGILELQRPALESIGEHGVGRNAFRTD